MPASIYEIKAERWLNSDKDLSLNALRGKVIAVEVFQMLCPGCVMHGLPQAKRIQATFHHQDLAVIGLHSVFEHHAAMTPTALEAFLYEFGIRFPVAIDKPVKPEGMRPETMRDWQLEGTPTLMLFDHKGALRAHHFGEVSDMAVGAEIMALIKDKHMTASTKA